MLQVMDDVPVKVSLGSTRLIDRLRVFIRSRNLAWATEKAYVHWIKRFIYFHKKRHPETMGAAEIEQFLSHLAVTEHAAAGTQGMGIHTAKQLRDADQGTIRKCFGVVVERICRELAGHSCLEFSEINEPNQQIIRSRSFGNLVADKTTLQAAVSTHVGSAVAVLREQGTLASVITVFIDTNRFREQDMQYHGSKTTALIFPSSDTLQFNQLAMQLLDDIFKPGHLYKKAGVQLAGIEIGARLQTDLFAQKDSPERDKLMQAMDALNGRFGRGTVQLATAMQSDDWRMSRQNLSSCYTTRISELFSAIC
jgi:DNA polymerase V